MQNKRNEPSLAEYEDPSFSQTVIAWQKQFGRHSLPWQKTDHAYHVWLSEIMLQQTQVTAVIPYYQRFLSQFPTVQSLALASSEEVMSLWSGLGYYTRARNLHQCAKIIQEKYQGHFPNDPLLLQELPGIGRSTAAAIAAFSYGTKAAILDGNVKRVFARFYAIEAYPGLKAIENDLWLRAHALLPDIEIQAYTQGLMDLGATVCTRNKPKCDSCPLQFKCLAYAHDKTAQLPVRKPKKIAKEKTATMLAIVHEGKVLLELRPESGIWGGLHSLPELDGMTFIDHQISEISFNELNNRIQQRASHFGEIERVEELPIIMHVFTHFKLHIKPMVIHLKKQHSMANQGSYVWQALNTIQHAALPAPIKNLLVALPGL